MDSCPCSGIATHPTCIKKKEGYVWFFAAISFTNPKHVNAGTSYHNPHALHLRLDQVH